MLDNTGYVSKDYTKFSFASFGGVSSLTPFLFLFSSNTLDLNNMIGFINDEKNPNLLNEYLKIIILLMRNNRENQSEAKRINFFKMMGVLLSEAERNFFTAETIYHLAELRNAINDSELAQEMFKDLFWKVEIYDKLDLQSLQEIWAYLRTIYLENPILYNGLFSIKEILDLIVNKLYFINKRLKNMMLFTKKLL